MQSDKYIENNIKYNCVYECVYVSSLLNQPFNSLDSNKLQISNVAIIKSLLDPFPVAKHRTLNDVDHLTEKE